MCRQEFARPFRPRLEFMREVSIGSLPAIGIFLSSSVLNTVQSAEMTITTAGDESRRRIFGAASHQQDRVVVLVGQVQVGRWGRLYN